MAEGDQFLFLGDWPIVLQGTVLLLYAQVVAFELWDGRQQRRVCFRDDDPHLVVVAPHGVMVVDPLSTHILILCFEHNRKNKPVPTPTFNYCGACDAAGAATGPG